MFSTLRAVCFSSITATTLACMCHFRLHHTHFIGCASERSAAPGVKVEIMSSLSAQMGGSVPPHRKTPRQPMQSDFSTDHVWAPSHLWYFHMQYCPVLRDFTGSSFVLFSLQSPLTCSVFQHRVKPLGAFYFVTPIVLNKTVQTNCSAPKCPLYT